MKTKTFVTLVATTLLMAACSNDEHTPDNGPVAASITAGVIDLGTRAIDNKWNADRIGVTVLDAPLSGMKAQYINKHYFTTAVGAASASFSPATGDDRIFFQSGKETVTFVAYAPYRPSLPGALPGNDGEIEHTLTPSDFTPERLPEIDYLWASATGKAVSPRINFTFKHVMSRLTFVFLKGDNIDKLDDIHCEIEGLYPSGTFDVQTGEAEVDTTQNSDVLFKFDIPFSTDMRTTFLAYPEQDRDLIITVQMGGKTYKATFPVAVEQGTMKPVPLVGGYSYTYQITLKKATLTVEQATIEAWKEGRPQNIPAVY